MKIFPQRSLDKLFSMTLTPARTQSQASDILRSRRLLKKICTRRTQLASASGDSKEAGDTEKAAELQSEGDIREHLVLFTASRLTASARLKGA